jgi:hypothetical protein
MDAYAFPPLAVRVVEVVLVDCQRGDGDLRRDVLQVFSKTGDLLAEHDRIHDDPVYAAYFLRGRVTPEMLSIWGGAGEEAAAQPASQEAAHG